MTKKAEVALKLISSGNEQKYFQGLCLLMEVYEEAPESLDPMSRALVLTTVKPIVKRVEKSLGVPVFDEEEAA